MFGWFRRRKTAERAEVAPRRRFMQLGNRRYITEVPYMLPKDLGEVNRLDFQHYMLRYILRGNFMAPLKRPTSVLDAGSGTSRWGIEVAQQFPQANVVGVDLVAPTALTGQPDNYVFVQGNVLEGLPFASENFDFVHQRLLILALPATAWQQAVNELARVTRRGGWVELVEARGVVHFPAGQAPSPNLRLLNEWSEAACQKRGIDLTLGPKIDTFLHAAGMANVALRDIPIPLGAHGGRVGQMMETNYFSALAGLKNLVVAMQVTSAEAYDAAVAGAIAEIAQQHCTFPYYVALGQKL